MKNWKISGIRDDCGLLLKQEREQEKGYKEINDTSKEAEQILIDGYRGMSAVKKMQQVSALTMAVQRMALARIRAQYGNTSDNIEKLRLAALWLPRDTMVKLFGWDPEKQGY